MSKGKAIERDSSGSGVSPLKENGKLYTETSEEANALKPFDYA